MSMTIYTYIAFIITLAGLLSYINHRFIQLQPTVAVLCAALILSSILLGLEKAGWVFHHYSIREIVNQFGFRDLVMNFMLGLLLFAGSLSIDLEILRSRKMEIAILAFLSTVISTFLIASGFYFLAKEIGFSIDFIYCLLFGALISPTDPVAVLGVFKHFKSHKELYNVIAAEALFNDGVGVVLFTTILSLAFFHVAPSVKAVTQLLLQQALGGVLFGLLLGWVCYHLLRPLKEEKIEIMLTLTMVLGGYTLAQALGISGPLAMVVFGIFLAHYRHDRLDGIKHRKGLQDFWDLVDELLNIVLFLLLGFELAAVHFGAEIIALSFGVIFLVLIVRYLTVALPMSLIHGLFRRPIPHAVVVLTWGGLRGGLAVALALSVPAGEVREILLALTYTVVLCSILVQGTSIKWLVSLCERRTRYVR